MLVSLSYKVRHTNNNINYSTIHDEDTSNHNRNQHIFAVFWLSFGYAPLPTMRRARSVPAFAHSRLEGLDNWDMLDLMPLDDREAALQVYMFDFLQKSKMREETQRMISPQCLLRACRPRQQETARGELPLRRGLDTAACTNLAVCLLNPCFPFAGAVPFACVWRTCRFGLQCDTCRVRLRL